MMHGFEPVNLSWRGKRYRIPARGMLPLIAQIEEILTQGTNKAAVEVLTRPGGPGFAKIAQVLGAVLRHVGEEVSDDEIYAQIDQAIADGEVDDVSAAQAVAFEVLSMISPAVARKVNGEAPGK